MELKVRQAVETFGRGHPTAGQRTLGLRSNLSGTTPHSYQQDHATPATRPVHLHPL